MSRRKPTALDLRESERRDAQPCSARCIYCPQWRYDGSAGEAREAARAHRAAVHPELPLVAVQPKRKRTKPAYEQTDADRQVISDLSERRRTMRGVSRSLLTEERLAEATSCYEQGKSVREIAAGRYEAWGYSSLDSLAVALYRLLPQRVGCWRGRAGSGRMNGRERIGPAREAVLLALYSAHWSLGQIAYLVSEPWRFSSTSAARAELSRRLRSAGVELRARTAVEQLPEISRSQALTLLAAAEGEDERKPVFVGSRAEELGFRGVALEAV